MCSQCQTPFALGEQSLLETNVETAQPTESLDMDIESSPDVAFSALPLPEPSQRKEFRSKDGKMSAVLKVWDSYLSPSECKQMFTECESLRETGMLKLEKGRTKRTSVGFGDPGFAYAYNGASHEERIWPTWLQNTRDPPRTIVTASTIRVWSYGTAKWNGVPWLPR